MRSALALFTGMLLATAVHALSLADISGKAAKFGLVREQDAHLEAT